MKLFKTIRAALAIAAMAALPVHAENYPAEPVKIIVPAGAGGGTDVLVRTIQPELEKELGGTIVVVNVPGSGSVGGSRRVFEAKPDGYSVLVNHVTLLTAMALGKADFKISDFKMSALSVEIPLVVVVPADSPIKNLDELMAATKGAEPVIAGVNLGAVNHFSMLMVKSAAKDAGDFRFVQTGGGAATTAALLGKHINVGVLAGSEALPIVKSGEVRVIAALGGDRISYFPDVPTAIEQGYDVNMGVEYMWLMPGGTPQDRVDAFGAALHKVMQNPEIISKLEERGMIPSFQTGAEAQGEIDTLNSTLQNVAKSIEQK